MDNGESSYRRFLDGDDEGFTEIIRDYQDGLIFFLAGMVGSLELAEELAEDTFVKIVIRRPTFRGGCAFKTWLYTVGRNVALDALRKRKRRIHPLPLDEALQSADSPASDGPEAAYLQNERDRTLHQAMSGLSPDHRQALWLTYFEQLPSREAARIMGKSPHAFESLLYRAKRALKSELERRGFDPE